MITDVKARYPNGVLTPLESWSSPRKLVQLEC